MLSIVFRETITKGEGKIINENKAYGRSTTYVRRRMRSIAATVSREVRRKYAVEHERGISVWGIEQGISVWRIERGVGARGMQCVLCRNLPSLGWAGVKPLVVDTWVSNMLHWQCQWASLRNPRTVQSDYQVSAIPSGIKTSTTIIINNGYQFSWRRWSNARSTFPELYYIRYNSEANPKFASDVGEKLDKGLDGNASIRVFLRERRARWRKLRFIRKWVCGIRAKGNIKVIFLDVIRFYTTWKFALYIYIYIRSNQMLNNIACLVKNARAIFFKRISPNKQRDIYY